jgi:hypothetical protein
MEQLGSHRVNFHEILCLGIFRTSVEKIQVSLEFEKDNTFFTWSPVYIHDKYLSQSFLEWEVLQTKVVEKIKTHILVQ